MKTTLVLYSEGNAKQFKDFPNKASCQFVNTKYSDLKSNTQGMRFTEIVINDLGVSLEDEAYANSIQVSKEFFDTHNKVMNTKITLEDKCFISLN